MLDMQKASRPSAAVQACNASYLGSRDGDDCGSRPASAKMVMRTISTEKTGHSGSCLSFHLHKEA
jgi:hypothetical protein